MQNAGATLNPIVVSLQPEGDGVPLFLVGPSKEAVSIVRYLGSRPVFGIRVPSPDRCPELRSVGDLAVVCAQAIQRAHPDGPYALAGWCDAGMLALEIARELEHGGGQIAFVAMLDARTVFLPPMSRRKRALVSCCYQLQRFRFFVSRVLAQGLSPIEVAARARLTRAREAKSRMWREPSRPDTISINALFRRHRPLPWRGRMLHIWAAERPRGSFRDPEFVCGYLSPDGFAFYEVAGSHATMLAEPNVGALCRILAEELDLAAGEPSRFHPIISF